MLSSSDAKFRCLWHMFVWSIMLTLVSQFYVLTDHIAFYIFGSLGILVLPFVTSLYSTTSGRRGARLLRVAYVLCDPVLACMAVVPVLLLNKLSPLIHEMECLSIDIKSWNDTFVCLGNKSSSPLRKIAREQKVDFNLKPGFWLERRNFLTAMEISIVIPCVLALIMGRRTRKMNYTTALLTFTYWLITSIECITLIETALICGSSRVHYAVTTEVTVCVACVLANSYAVVTLCSYVSPITCRGDSAAVAARFNNVYKCVVGLTGVVFVEIPQLVARIQLVASTSDWPSMSEGSNYLYHGAFNYGNSIYERHGYSNDHEPSDSNGTLEGSSDGDVESFSSMPDQDDLSNDILLSQSIINITRSLEDRSLVYKLHLPATFYVWAFKDAIMIIIIIAAIALQKFGSSPPILFRILGEGRGCAGVAFDNPNAMFIPEKRDKYIITRCSQCREAADYRDGTPRPNPLRNNQRLTSMDSAEESSFYVSNNHVHKSSPKDHFRNRSNKYFSKKFFSDAHYADGNIFGMTSVHSNGGGNGDLTVDGVKTDDNTESEQNEMKDLLKSGGDDEALENKRNIEKSTNGVMALGISRNLPDNIKQASQLNHQTSLDAVGHEKKRKKSVKFSLSENGTETSKTQHNNNNGHNGNNNNNNTFALSSVLKNPSNHNYNGDDTPVFIDNADVNNISNSDKVNICNDLVR